MPDWVVAMVAWLREERGGRNAVASEQQARLFTTAYYNEEAPAIRSEAELRGAIEHLEYAIFRRYNNALTRAERSRLDNTISNAIYKVDRYIERLTGPEREAAEVLCHSARHAAVTGREQLERRQRQARRADLKLAQLSDLTPEGFEEFVAELFEALCFEVDRVGGSGDEGADLIVTRGGQRGVVQCKYTKGSGKGVIGSPELQKFLGTIHHTHSHKGYFVTTRAFSLAAERFTADHPIELIDGPRLVELVHEAMGPSRSASEPDLFANE